MTKYWEKQMEHRPTREYFQTLLGILCSLFPTPDVRALEIGTGWGISGSAFIGAGILDLTSVDPNLNTDYGRKTKAELQSKSGDTKITFIDERIEVLGGPHHERDFCTKNAGKFDVVFVDGDHGYTQCLYDLILADKVTPDDGFIIVDDYLHKNNFNGKDYGVARAVSEFLKEKRYSARIYPFDTNGLLLIRKKV